MVYPTSDQKAEGIVLLLVEEIVPFASVPKAFLSVRGNEFTFLLISFSQRNELSHEEYQ